MTQPEGGGDAIGEAAACERLEQVRSEVNDDLDCDLEQTACPELIRPFGADPCQRYVYDEDSVEACVSAIEGYDSCADFAGSPCVVTALIRSQAECDGVGAAGSGGGGDSGGSAGGGSGGSGTGGNSSAGGAAGQAGAAGGSG